MEQEQDNSMNFQRWLGITDEVRKMHKEGFDYKDIRLRVCAIWSVFLGKETVENILALSLEDPI